MRPTLKPLTSARFFAAAFVVIFHYGNKLAIFPAGVADFGYQPVAFFFILSGFILTYAHATSEGLNVSVYEFFCLRLVRIFPGYLLALLLAFPFVLGILLKQGFNAEILLVPPMLQSWWPPASLLWNGPAWSLSNEVFFYALFPVIWMIYNRLDAVAGLASASALILCAATVRTLGNFSHNFSAYFPLLNLPQFILGIALAKLWLSFGKFIASGAWLSVGAVFLAAIIYFKLAHPWLGSDLILCPLFAAIIYLLAGSIILSARPLVVLGDASYALYILHAPIWLWWDHIIRVSLGLRLVPLLDFTCYATLAVLCSVATLYLIERPARKLLYSRSWFRVPIAAHTTSKSPYSVVPENG